MNSIRGIVLISLSLGIAGCASMASHNTQANKVEQTRHTGGIPAAIAELETSAKTPQQKAELLFNMERGQLQRLNKDIPASTESLLVADQSVRRWEDLAKTNPSKLMGLVGASLISERLSTYEGRDYEKVWVTTLLAMNRLSANDIETARVDIKRTHEREGVIAAYRSKQLAASEKEARDKGVKNQAKSINGYPVQTLEDPEVINLRNGYQNALSHYLAGFVYEIGNEPGLAAAGYRQAIELRPGAPLLEAALRGLDDRVSLSGQRKQNGTDVLFVIEAGNGPARVSRQYTLPIVLPGAVRTMSVSYPVIEPSRDPIYRNIAIDDQKIAMEQVVDLNVMARRELRDEMPGLITRNITRAIAKGAMQKELENRGGLLGSVIGAVAAAATEQADDRIWRTLPGRVYIARAEIPEGNHHVIIGDRDAGMITVSGRYAIVPLRLMDDTVISMPISHFGSLNTSASIDEPSSAPRLSDVEPIRLSFASDPR